MFSGRLNRRYFLLLITLLYSVSITLNIMLLSLGDSGENSLLILPIVILSIPLTLLWFSIHIRRFHDIGMSSWFIFIMIFPLSSFVLGLIPGDKNSNKYGKKP